MKICEYCKHSIWFFQASGFEKSFDEEYRYTLPSGKTRNEPSGVTYGSFYHKKCYRKTRERIGGTKL